jgi:hypothetical protein
MTQDARTPKTAVNRAYVLIETEAGKASEIAEALRRRFRIARVDLVEGPYAVIAVVEGADISAMAKTIAVDIRALTGVKDIIVYMAKKKERLATGTGGR